MQHDRLNEHNASASRDLSSIVYSRPGREADLHLTSQPSQVTQKAGFRKDHGKPSIIGNPGRSTRSTENHWVPMVHL
jgi:hypothetical protein